MNRVDKYHYHPECAEMHVLIELIARGKGFFTAKTYNPNKLIMHIPLPVQDLIVQSMGGFGVKTQGNVLTILGIKCLPGYENRIVICHPDYAIYNNEPMVVIDLGKYGTYPTYYEFG